MGSPVPEVNQTPHGRKGWAHFHVEFTQQDTDDLSNEIVLSRDYLSGDYEDGQNGKVRLAVDHIEWSSSLNVSADVEWDSIPGVPSSRVLSIPEDASAGEINFKDYPSGCHTDPYPAAPGNLVITTRGALPGDEINLSIVYREKGRRVA